MAKEETYKRKFFGWGKKMAAGAVGGIIIVAAKAFNIELAPEDYDMIFKLAGLVISAEAGVDAVRSLGELFAKRK